MRVKVTKDAVAITEYTSVNAGERGVNLCELQLPAEFSDLTVTASFNNIPVPVSEGECVIPTLKKGTAVLGVYAYKEGEQGVELMYSPKPTVFYVSEGSYTGEVAVESAPSAGEFEKYCQQFTALLAERVADSEKTKNKTTALTEDSTHEQYPTAKAVYDGLQKFNRVTALEKNDFVNGAFADKQGVTPSDFWLITPESVSVGVGDIIKIKPSEGLKVWWRIYNSSDLSVALNLLNGGIVTGEIEYVSEFDGYFNVQIAKTDGTQITPGDYGCYISVHSSRVDELERAVEEIKGDMPLVLDGVAVDEEHTNAQVYGAKAMDEALVAFGETLEQAGKSKVFERIATLTVTADENGNLPSAISITKDDNGKPFELTDFYCDVLIGLTDGANGKLYIQAGGTMMIGALNAYFLNSLRKWNCRYDSCGEGNGGLFVAPNGTIASTTNFPNNNVTNMVGQPVPVGHTVNINSLKFVITTGTAKTFLEGTTITLWGVRK